jgi:hypothetical protein
MNERWLSVPDYEDLYEASSHGINIHLGYFDTPESAGLVAQCKRQELKIQ